MISDSIDTFKGFKHYEWWAFIPFMGCSVMFGYQLMFLPAVISLCACMWVFTSSGWRQRLQSIYDAIDEASEVQEK